MAETSRRCGFIHFRCALIPFRCAPRVQRCLPPQQAAPPACPHSPARLTGLSTDYFESAQTPAARSSRYVILWCRRSEGCCIAAGHASTLIARATARRRPRLPHINPLLTYHHLVSSQRQEVQPPLLLLRAVPTITMVRVRPRRSRAAAAAEAVLPPAPPPALPPTPPPPPPPHPSRPLTTGSGASDDCKLVARNVSACRPDMDCCAAAGPVQSAQSPPHRLKVQRVRGVLPCEGRWTRPDSHARWLPQVYSTM